MLATIKRIYALPTATRPHAALTWVLGYLFALGLAVLAAPRAALQDPAPWVLALAYTLTAFVAQGWLALPGAHPLSAVLAPLIAIFAVAAVLVPQPGWAFWLAGGAGAAMVLGATLMWRAYRERGAVATLGARARALFPGPVPTGPLARVIVADPDELSAREREALRLHAAHGAALVHPAAVEANLKGRVDLDHVVPELVTGPPWIYARSKRALDLLLVLLVLPVVVPLVLVTALALAVAGRLWPEEAGPVFFIQERVGFRGRPFRMVKFRTMRVGSDRNGPMYAVNNDHRITRLGRWLRKFRLDELPQLWNVLRGEMSLVGPRPEPIQSAAAFAERIPHYELRTRVPPGVTGWAQVQQGYAAGDEETRVKLAHDLYYIQHASLLFDLYVLVRTVTTVVFGRGAQ